jgi:20S proteasome subunit alpha 2
MSDYSLTTFGEGGELTQVRHALTAVGNGETTVGIKAKNGVVIAAEKKLPTTLIDESSVHKVSALCDYMGATYSGIGPDFHAVLGKMRKDVQGYHAVYRDRATPYQICKHVTELIQEYTHAGGVRPFGIGIMVAGFDEDMGPQIYQIEASGTFYCWKATAMGRGGSDARTFLERTYTDDMDIGDAEHTAIKALKQSFEGEMTHRNIEIGVIKTSDPEKKFRILSESEVIDLLKEVE